MLFVCLTQVYSQSYQQCSMRLSETGGYIQSRQSADLFNGTLQSEDLDYSDTDERAAIRR